MIQARIFLTLLMIIAIWVNSIITPNSQISMEIESSEAIDWIDLAKTAWKYFQPGVGISSSTGLNYATLNYHYLTDWDLGSYLMAIIDAEKLGILPRDGKWGADYRINKIISFLKTRKLTDSGLPYWFYDSDTGDPDVSKGQGNPSDSGRLLIALYILKKYRPSLADDIDYIISRTNYEKFAERVATDGFYAYYLAHGYSFFGFNTVRVKKALNFINRIPTMKHVQVYNESLPVTEITMEPILQTIFELNVNKDFQKWAYKIYKAQEERYIATGKPTAFTEGAIDKSPYYIYEWIVYTNGKVWYIMSPKGEQLNIPPIVYSKAAIGMYAIWPTEYTEKLVKYVLRTKTDKGFYEGVNEDGKIIRVLTDKTNALIISAARYAIDSIIIKPKLSLKLSTETLTLYKGESDNIIVEVSCTINVDASLSISGIPEGITTSFNPQSGTTNFTSILTISASNSAKEGKYTLSITAQSPDADPATANLTLTIKAKLHKLVVKVMDWDLEDTIPNAEVHLGNEVKSTNSSGIVEWNNLSGNITIRVSYLGVWVSDPINIEMNQDKLITVQGRFYDIYIRVLTTSGKPIPNINLTISLNKVTLTSDITNQTGYTYFKNIPAGNITVTAYTGKDYKTKLGEWNITINNDEQIIDPEVKINNLTRKNPTHLIIILTIIIILITAIFFYVKKKMSIPRLKNCYDENYS